MNILKLLVCTLSIIITAKYDVGAQESSESRNMLKLSDAFSSFSLRLYSCWLYNNVTNIYVCPVSIIQVLSAFHFGLRGKSAEVISELLGYTKMNMTRMDVMEAFYLLATKYLSFSSRRTVFDISSTILVKQDVELIPVYKHFAEQIFKVHFTVVDTKKSPEDLFYRLNQWVATRTRYRITNIMDEIHSSEEVIALNVINFEAVWKYRFSLKKTSKEIFYNNGIVKRAKEIPMMQMTRFFKHYRARYHRILELPFKEQELSMYIFLPKYIDGIQDAELDLERSISEDLANMELKNLKITIPKFKFQSSAFLSRCLSFTSDGKHFIPDPDDLSVMFRNKSLSLGELYHKTHIEVTEEGVNVLPNDSRSFMKPEVRTKNLSFFKMDHPFIFIIKDLKNEIILFIGRVEEI